MPLYSFKCEEHGEYDLLQSMKDEHTGKCPNCKRVYSIVGISGDLPTLNTIKDRDKKSFYKDLKDEGII